MSDEDEDKTANEPLSTRETAELLFRDPAVRSYTYAALGAVAMVFVVMFLNGSDIGAVLVVLLASAGLILRWIAAPPLVLVIVCYFQLFPFGFPDAGFESPFEVRDSHFRVVDAVLAMAVLVGRYHRGYALMRSELAKAGATVVRFEDGDPVRLVLDRLDRLRGMRSRR